MSILNPCLSCGACCAFFLVSFYWAEADAAPQGWVPAHLTEVISPHLCAMQGTNTKKPRCTALLGQIGERVACEIYTRRPSVCHEVMVGDGKCLRARLAHGLSSLDDSMKMAPAP